MEYNLNTGGDMDGGTALSLFEKEDQSIVLYWVIMCCDWVGGGALSCLTWRPLWG